MFSLQVQLVEDPTLTFSHGHISTFQTDSSTHLTILRYVWITCFSPSLILESTFSPSSLNLPNNPSLFTYSLRVFSLDYALLGCQKYGHIPFMPFWISCQMGISLVCPLGSPHMDILPAIPFGALPHGQFYLLRHLPSLAIFSSNCSNHLSFPFYWVSLWSSLLCLLFLLKAMPGNFHLPYWAPIRWKGTHSSVVWDISLWQVTQSIWGCFQLKFLLP